MSSEISFFEVKGGINPNPSLANLAKFCLCTPSDMALSPQLSGNNQPVAPHIFCNVGGIACLDSCRLRSHVHFEVSDVPVIGQAYDYIMNQEGVYDLCHSSRLTALGLL